jgi:hypothetical protein
VFVFARASGGLCGFVAWDHFGAAIRIRDCARDPVGFGERMAVGGAREGVGADLVGAV